jgi:hypothetical protein
MWSLFLCNERLDISRIAKCLEIEEDLLVNITDDLGIKGILARLD